jgi:type II secretory pathway pseudopilin PulG
MSVRREHGFALVDLVFVCGIIGILASIALPRMLTARQAASATSAIGSLRAVNSGQLTYAFTCGFGFYAPNLTTLGALPEGSNEAFISPGLGSEDEVIRSGYLFTMSAEAVDSAPASCNGLDAGEGGSGFKATADPIEPGNGRYFGTNASVEIFEHSSSLQDDLPENGEPEVGFVIH